MQNPEQYQIIAVNKYSNSAIIKGIYPMIKRIEVFWVKEIETFLFKIYLNDSSIDVTNMYKKGIDPHYLVDIHIKNFFPYISLDKNIATDLILFGPKGNVVYRSDY